jgi:DNA-binding transcriptional LysR family regulator
VNRFDLAETFIIIVDSGSLIKASVALNQTTAAISKKLTKIENYLGAQLLIRTKKGIKLTESGQRYYHEAKNAIEAFKTAELSVKNSNTIPSGELKIVANYYYAEKIILPKLNAFVTAYPNISLNIETAEIHPDFSSKDMDILIGVSLPGADNLIRKKIDTTRYALCASPQYFQNLELPHTPSEILQHHFICHSARRPDHHITLDNEQILVVKQKLLFNNTEMIINAALHGLGLIWTHENILQKYLDNGQLVKVLPSFTTRLIDIYLYYEYQKYIDPKITAFLNFFFREKN